MSETALSRADELRAAFDRSFAAAPDGERVVHDSYLSLRCGGDLYALPVREIAGLYANRKIQSLPSRLTALRGIAALRGALLPAYELEMLLGYGASRSGDASMARWLILLPGQQRLALTANQLDGYLHLPVSALTDEARDPARVHIRAGLRSDKGLHAVLDTAALTRSVESMVRTASFKGS